MPTAPGTVSAGSKTMIAVAEHLSTYLDEFEQLAKVRASEPTWLGDRRRAGMQRFSEAGFPTTRHEEYKYTNLTPLARTPFRTAPERAGTVSREQIAPYLFAGLRGDNLVFVNGRYVPGLSQINASSGVEVASLAAKLDGPADGLQTHLGLYSGARDNPLAALNSAFLADGAVVKIAARQVVEASIHLLFVSTADAPDTVTHPRVLILAGLDSQAAVIESYVGIGEETYWTNTVTEIVVEANARLDYYKLQQEQPRAFHTSLLEIRQGRDSRVATRSLSLGGLLARNDVEVVLNGEGCDAVLDGLYAVTGRQHVDNRTCIDHAQPYCTSHQLYKGVLDGHSRGVFNGKIIVRPDAQKTDAIQSNKNLLLSENADINTKPQLQIDANDVRCTHGATVGQIDEEATFYLRSRGIGHAQARSLLTYAFAAEVLERVNITPVRERFESLLMHWLVEGTEKGK